MMHLFLEVVGVVGLVVLFLMAVGIVSLLRGGKSDSDSDTAGASDTERKDKG